MPIFKIVVGTVITLAVQISTARSRYPYQLSKLRTHNMVHSQAREDMSNATKGRGPIITAESVDRCIIHVRRWESHSECLKDRQTIFPDEDLLGPYIIITPPKTKEVLKRAMNGVSY
jgi:hypothetical protein